MTGDIDLEACLRVARLAAEQAIAITRDSPLGEIRTKKHDADVVTEIDTGVEQAVRGLIKAELPGHVVVGEEYGGTAGDGPTWYCDPVDGTTNLTAGLPWTSFSLAMAVGRTPLVGVVADPWRQEIWLTAAGRGVTVNGRPPAISAPASLAGGVIGTEWASYQPWPGMINFLQSLADRHCTTRVMGSSTLTLAQVAVGRTVGAVIGEFHPEDHLAAALLCKEAGMIVRDEAGNADPFPESRGILAARPQVADELFELWQAAIAG
ncbi:Myo-inositol-monophosphatase [Microlunatus endophyticus]|uniref:Myo-inositol-monophosphatase n=1 Tax=Microlunatus endophyticus TaxID=1716077 RepID=A0A917S8E9_9ACTN|nr:inositol monophosphatase family protein [Microlunatus endophyticus]GGL61197.1 Myo-inositol-monophosphatase [Microlunatus endophyticus]